MATKKRGPDTKPRTSKTRRGTKGPPKVDKKARLSVAAKALRQQVIALVTGGEKTLKEIYTELGLSRAGLYQILVEPGVAGEIQRIITETGNLAEMMVKQRVVEIAERLSRVALGEINASKEGVTAMRDLLDRNGYQAPKKIELTAELGLSQFSDEQLKQIATKGELPS